MFRVAQTCMMPYMADLLLQIIYWLKGSFGK